MRMLLRVSIPVETGNAAAKAGTLGSTVEGILADLKPEAAYFMADDHGNRSASIVFDLKDTSHIPAIAEPWFLAFNAKVSLRPVMNAQDLDKAWSIHWQGRQEIREVVACRRDNVITRSILSRLFEAPPAERRDRLERVAW